MQNSTDTPTLTPTGQNQNPMPHSHSRLLTGLLIAFNILLIMLLYLCFYKYFFGKRPSSTATTDTPDSTPPSSPRNTGRALELHAITSIPIVDFNTIGAEKVECAVCLTDFKDGDKVRVLPQCSHRFHVECIDTWFQSHANCPYCRTLIEEKAGTGSESMV